MSCVEARAAATTKAHISTIKTNSAVRRKTRIMAHAPVWLDRVDNNQEKAGVRRKLPVT